MIRTRSVTAGLVIAALLGVADLLSLIMGGPPEGEVGPPVEVLVAGTALGAITLLGVAAAWRGRRWGIVTVIVTRVLSALTAVPAFFADGVPAPLVAFAAAGIAITVLCIALLAPALRTGRVPATV